MAPTAPQVLSLLHAINIAGVLQICGPQHKLGGQQAHGSTSGFHYPSNSKAHAEVPPNLEVGSCMLCKDGAELVSNHPTMPNVTLHPRAVHKEGGRNQEVSSRIAGVIARF